MINFNFTLTDEEADLLLNLIRDHINDIQGRSIDSASSQPVKEWMVKHRKFVEGMKKKILDGQERANDS